MTLKVQSGKLGLPAATAVYIPARLNHYRMLVAQAQVERLPIVTHDPQVRKYAVETIW
jgi:PIN domain nuclease of toxin-antitoxin system